MKVVFGRILMRLLARMALEAALCGLLVGTGGATPPPPVAIAKARFSPEEVWASIAFAPKGATVYFTATQPTIPGHTHDWSYDPDDHVPEDGPYPVAGKGIVNYKWEYKEENEQQWVSFVPPELQLIALDASCKFPAGGEYTVRLTVTDNDGYPGGPRSTIAQCTVYVAAVEITDDLGNELPAPPPDGQNLLRCVGQKISLKGKTFPQGHGGSDWEWTIPGHVVRNYVIAVDDTTAVVTELTDAHKHQNAVVFYWITGGNAEVSVTCDVLNFTVTDTVGFNIEAPTLHSFGATKTGPVDVGPEWSAGTSVYCGHPHYGDIPVEWGIEWEADVSAPDHFDGRIKYTQLLSIWFRVTRVDNSTESRKTPQVPPAIYWLDTQDPYIEYVAQAGSRHAYGSFDAPHANHLEWLAGYKRWEFVVNDFDLYLMYRPSPQDSDNIWVPVGRLVWGFVATAESNDAGTTWTKTAGGHTIPNPNGFATTLFPEWPDKYSWVGNPPWQAD